MKRKSLVTGAVVVALAMCWVGFVSAITISPSDQVFARRYGTNQSKTFSTLTNALTLLGSNVARTLVIDGGAWTCTNSLHWPSNIAMEIRPDSSINISTDMVMNLDGVNILDPGNRLIFPGTGIATGPVGNAYAMANWQGARSFYLAPLVAPGSFATTGDLSAVTNNLIAITTNGDVSVSNGVTLYTREQIAASNALLTTFVDETYLKTGSPVQVSSISYTSMPYIGINLAMSSANGQRYDGAYTNLGSIEMTNWTLNSDFYGFWDTDDEALRPTLVGKWAMNLAIAFTDWGATDPSPYIEVIFVKNAISNKFDDDVGIQFTNAGQSVFIDEASGVNGKSVVRGIASGAFLFSVTNGQTTNDKYEIFWSCLNETARVNSATMSYHYLGTTNLAK